MFVHVGNQVERTSPFGPIGRRRGRRPSVAGTLALSQCQGDGDGEVESQAGRPHLGWAGSAWAGVHNTIREKRYPTTLTIARSRACTDSLAAVGGELSSSSQSLCFSRLRGLWFVRLWLADMSAAGEGACTTAGRQNGQSKSAPVQCRYQYALHSELIASQ
ncbi:hypothetical protein MAPG_03840 [Magnaporthiopsis poae ATCC 64411]|uniref:Uncharacterized protein n=1 Tax=Magnaporthiopsis poae (strain ATCC 64411 / 73-15) TaxID=644358 RepID=A0A0C4DV40_MAGP6|nr:hypothetical protein MAPG_03840 [Magnaporthiopsis poae ATCC 64411]